MATATVSPTRSVIVSFDAKDRRAAKFVETLKLMDFFQVEESPYNPEYVAKIKAIDAIDKRKYKTIKSQDLWK